MAVRSASSLLASRIAELAEDEAEHLLVAAALDQAVQRACHHPAGARAAQDARHDARDEAAGAAVLHGGEDARQHGGERDRRGARRGGIGEEAMQDAGQVEARQHAGDLVGGEHVGGDEAAEGGAETLLLVGDDGGVRDRDAERVAEQRGDREPVGDAADEARLGGGLQQVGGSGGGEGVAAQREGGHQDQQRRWRRRGGGAACAGLRRRGLVGSWEAAAPVDVSVSPASHCPRGETVTRTWVTARAVEEAN